jgi:hypothetical protein
MKEKAEVVRGWLRKADSDMVALEAALGAGPGGALLCLVSEGCDGVLSLPLPEGRS